MQLNKINPLLDELIDHIWLTIYNKNRENNEIINIDIVIDKNKDIKGCVYKKIIHDKFEFVNKIVELYNNAIDKKEFNNLKDDVLKLIDTNSICDVERKVSEKDNKKKIVVLKEKPVKKIMIIKKIVVLKEKPVKKIIAKMLIKIKIKII